MVWWWAVPLIGGCFGVRRLSDWQPKGVCGTSTFDETARLLDAAICALESRQVGLARRAPKAAALASIWELAVACGG